MTLQNKHILTYLKYSTHGQLLGAYNSLFLYKNAHYISFEGNFFFVFKFCIAIITQRTWHILVQRSKHLNCRVSKSKKQKFNRIFLLLEQYKTQLAALRKGAREIKSRLTQLSIMYCVYSFSYYLFYIHLKEEERTWRQHNGILKFQKYLHNAIFIYTISKVNYFLFFCCCCCCCMYNYICRSVIVY